MGFLQFLGLRPNPLMAWMIQEYSLVAKRHDSGDGPGAWTWAGRFGGHALHLSLSGSKYRLGRLSLCLGETEDAPALAFSVPHSREGLPSLDRADWKEALLAAELPLLVGRFALLPERDDALDPDLLVALAELAERLSDSVHAVAIWTDGAELQANGARMSPQSISSDLRIARDLLELFQRTGSAAAGTDDLRIRAAHFGGPAPVEHVSVARRNRER